MKRRLLSFFKVEERPDPPPGSGPSLSTFRASRRALYMSFAKWMPKQISNLLGIVVALIFFGIVDVPFVEFTWWDSVLGFFDELAQEGEWLIQPRWVFNGLEILTILFFILQTYVSGMLLKLSWDLRWYMVGDESLRIREGLWLLREQTITIANIQNMSVRQGPLQKLFGIADLEVHTAGGGAAAKPAGDGNTFRPLHVARFRGVEDAEGLRDRIRARLVLHRGAGLGDADEHVDDDEGEADAGPSGSELAEAALELLGETRALRRDLTAS